MALGEVRLRFQGAIWLVEYSLAPFLSQRYFAGTLCFPALLQRFGCAPTRQGIASFSLRMLRNCANLCGRFPRREVRVFNRVPMPSDAVKSNYIFEMG